MKERIKIVREWPKGSEEAKREKKIRDAMDIVILWLKSGEWKNECSTALDEKAMELYCLLRPVRSSSLAKR